MEQRVTIVTVRAEDIEAATRYYVEGLGWVPVLAVPGEVAFFQVAPGVVLGLFDAAGFDADAGQPIPAGFNLAQNHASEAEVDAAVADLVAAGGTLLKAPVRAEWGGYHGFVMDGAGVCWEVAYNPGLRVADDGAVTFGD